MATDFREGRGFPRRGRLPAGRLLWLLRLFDKARAAAYGRIDVDYDNDEAILRWAQQTITKYGIDEANSWLVVEKFENLDRQDREEGAFDAQPA
jgi:hypothetical protein